jgi:hypothetical protein
VEVSRLEVRAGGYLIVPTTYEPGMEANWTLTVFMDHPFKLDIA